MYSRRCEINIARQILVQLEIDYTAWITELLSDPYFVCGILGCVSNLEAHPTERGMLIFDDTGFPNIEWPVQYL